MKDWLRYLILCLPFVAGTMSVPSRADTFEPGMVNPGSIDHPSWFKLSFLDIREDVKEAAEAKKRVVLYFYQDGCPYCLKLIREGFTDQTIVNQASRDFDVVALNIFGSREVTDVNGHQWTESQFAASRKVQFTPTLMYLNEDGEVILRLNGYHPPEELRIAFAYAAAKPDRQGISIRDYLSTLNPKVSRKGLHTEEGFLTSPFRLADHQRRSGRPLIVMLEQPTCLACDELHQDTLRRRPVADALEPFDGVIIDVWSSGQLQTPDGREMSIGDWVRELRINYTPSLIFFDPSGQEVFRTEGYLKSFHVEGVLTYVSTQAYKKQPNFQRYLRELRRNLETSGRKIELMD